MESVTYRHSQTDTLGRVEWKTIRSAFIRARKAAGVKQDALATRAGLRQGDISKIESNDKRGPTVANFVSAVEKGLQIPVSEFFRQIEIGAHGRSVGANPATLEDIVDVERDSISGFSAEHYDDLARVFAARAAQVRRNRQHSPKERRPSRRKAGGR